MRPVPFIEPAKCCELRNVDEIIIIIINLLMRGLNMADQLITTITIIMVIMCFRFSDICDTVDAVLKQLKTVLQEVW